MLLDGGVLDDALCDPDQGLLDNWVRSTDLLTMFAVPQDQSYAIEVQIEEAITTPFVVF